MSCQICLEDYSKKLVQITCQHCPTNACRGCLQRYLLQSYEDPHCVSCKRGWSTEFMAANFPLSFRNDALRKHRRKILFEREKSILPTMQVFVEYRRNIIESEDIYVNVLWIEGFEILLKQELVAISTGMNQTDYRKMDQVIATSKEEVPRYIDLERLVKEVIEFKKQYPGWILERIQNKIKK